MSDNAKVSQPVKLLETDFLYAVEWASKAEKDRLVTSMLSIKVINKPKQADKVWQDDVLTPAYAQLVDLVQQELGKKDEDEKNYYLNKVEDKYGNHKYSMWQDRYKLTLLVDFGTDIIHEDPSKSFIAKVLEASIALSNARSLVFAVFDWQTGALSDIQLVELETTSKLGVEHDNQNKEDYINQFDEYRQILEDAQTKREHSASLGKLTDEIAQLNSADRGIILNMLLDKVK